MPELSHSTGEIISYNEMRQAWSVSLQKGMNFHLRPDCSVILMSRRSRIGSYEFSAAQLKTIQEVITLSVFSIFSITHLGEPLKWNYAAGFGCIALAVFFVFHQW